MNKVYLLSGSSLGDREKFLKLAYEGINSRIGLIRSSSSIYETEPWGFAKGNHFLNQCLLIETTLSPEEVLDVIHELEYKSGRIRIEGQVSNRTLDIDILFFNDEIIRLGNLEIPHRDLHRRKFALVPMVEIEPEYIHPVFQKPVRELLQECNDMLEVKKYYTF